MFTPQVIEDNVKTYFNNLGLDMSKIRNLIRGHEKDNKNIYVFYDDIGGDTGKTLLATVLQNVLCNECTKITENVYQATSFANHADMIKELLSKRLLVMHSSDLLKLNDSLLLKKIASHDSLNIEGKIIKINCKILIVSDHGLPIDLQDKIEPIQFTKQHLSNPALWTLMQKKNHIDTVRKFLTEEVVEKEIEEVEEEFDYVIVI